METKDQKTLEKYRLRYQQLKEELQSLGFVCVGSLQTRRMECGKKECRCHEAAENRHGPYHYRMRKVQGRTVAAQLHGEDVTLYREWIKNNRRLAQTVREMRKVSARVLALQTGKKR